MTQFDKTHPLCSLLLLPHPSELLSMKFFSPAQKECRWSAMCVWDLGNNESNRKLLSHRISAQQSLNSRAEEWSKWNLLCMKMSTTMPWFGLNSACYCLCFKRETLWRPPSSLPQSPLLTSYFPTTMKEKETQHQKKTQFLAFFCMSEVQNKIFEIFSTHNCSQHDNLICLTINLSS